MPILPIIDLLIVLSWTVLACGAFLKAIHITTSYRWSLLGLTPMECVMVAGVLLLLALALAARTWLKANEPALIRRRAATDLNALNAYAPSRGEERLGVREQPPEHPVRSAEGSAGS